MKIKLGNLSRLTYGLSAFALTVAFTVSMVLPGVMGQASAAQVTTRSMQMSDSTPSATSVSYKLTFTPVTTTQELIVDFCGDTPLIGATCAFAAGTVPNVTGVGSSLGTATTVGSGTPVHTIKVTGLTMTGGSPYTITFTGLTNPSSATSFYARVLTYGTGNATGYAPANATGGTTTTGTNVDYGGLALSTANAIAITARVMETLTFCVSATALSPDCPTATTPSIVLGHGSPTATLSSTQVDVASVYTQLSTNAQTGAVVRMKASNSCTNGGLSSNGGSTCTIPGVGGTAAAIAAGTAAVGMCVAPGSNSTATAPYIDATNSCPTTWGATNKYGMDGNGATGTTSTYGGQIFATSAAVNAENNRCTFAATASLTTPAGIYTANESLIATGTF